MQTVAALAACGGTHCCASPWPLPPRARLTHSTPAHRLFEAGFTGPELKPARDLVIAQLQQYARRRRQAKEVALFEADKAALKASRVALEQRRAEIESGAARLREAEAAHTERARTETERIAKQWARLHEAKRGAAEAQAQLDRAREAARRSVEQLEAQLQRQEAEAQHTVAAMQARLEQQQLLSQSRAGAVQAQLEQVQAEAGRRGKEVLAQRLEMQAEQAARSVVRGRLDEARAATVKTKEVSEPEDARECQKREIQRLLNLRRKLLLRNKAKQQAKARLAASALSSGGKLRRLSINAGMPVPVGTASPAAPSLGAAGAAGLLPELTMPAELTAERVAVAEAEAEAEAEAGARSCKDTIDVATHHTINSTSRTVKDDDTTQLPTEQASKVSAHFAAVKAETRRSVKMGERTAAVGVERHGAAAAAATAANSSTGDGGTTPGGEGAARAAVVPARAPAAAPAYGAPLVDTHQEEADMLAVRSGALDKAAVSLLAGSDEHAKESAAVHVQYAVRKRSMRRLRERVEEYEHESRRQLWQNLSFLDAAESKKQSAEEQILAKMRDNLATGSDHWTHLEAHETQCHRIEPGEDESPSASATQQQFAQTVQQELAPPQALPSAQLPAHGQPIAPVLTQPQPQPQQQPRRRPQQPALPAQTYALQSHNVLPTERVPSGTLGPVGFVDRGGDAAGWRAADGRALHTAARVSENSRQATDRPLGRHTISADTVQTASVEACKTDEHAHAHEHAHVHAHECGAWHEQGASLDEVGSPGRGERSPRRSTKGTKAMLLASAGAEDASTQSAAQRHGQRGTAYTAGTSTVATPSRSETAGRRGEHMCSSMSVPRATQPEQAVARLGPPRDQGSWSHPRAGRTRTRQQAASHGATMNSTSPHAGITVVGGAHGRGAQHVRLPAGYRYDRTTSPSHTVESGHLPHVASASQTPRGTTSGDTPWPVTPTVMPTPPRSQPEEGAPSNFSLLDSATRAAYRPFVHRRAQRSVRPRARARPRIPAAPPHTDKVPRPMCAHTATSLLAPRPQPFLLLGGGPPNLKSPRRVILSGRRSNTF